LKVGAQIEAAAAGDGEFPAAVGLGEGEFAVWALPDVAVLDQQFDARSVDEDAALLVGVEEYIGAVVAAPNTLELEQVAVYWSRRSCRSRYRR
jgi:hypothetical protein